MKSKYKINFFISVFLLILFIGVTSCQSNDDSLDMVQDSDLSDPDPMFQSLQCRTQVEQSDYSIYKMASNGKRIGDLMPIYDDASNKFYLYYLKDIWNDNSNQRHPWHAISTTDFSSYNEIPTEIISSSSAGCDQTLLLVQVRFLLKTIPIMVFILGIILMYYQAV